PPVTQLHCAASSLGWQFRVIAAGYRGRGSITRKCWSECTTTSYHRWHFIWFQTLQDAATGLGAGPFSGTAVGVRLQWSPLREILALEGLTKDVGHDLSRGEHFLDFRPGGCSIDDNYAEAGAHHVLDHPGSEPLEEAFDCGDAGKVGLRGGAAIGGLEDQRKCRAITPGAPIKDLAFDYGRVELGFHLSAPT